MKIMNTILAAFLGVAVLLTGCRARMSSNSSTTAPTTVVTTAPTTEATTASTTAPTTVPTTAPTTEAATLPTIETTEKETDLEDGTIAEETKREKNNTSR